eukprot:scaffold7104_cov107-Amphora_coffeaeformis.AAC.1
MPAQFRRISSSFFVLSKKEEVRKVVEDEDVHSVNAMAATHRHATTAQTLRNLSYNNAMNPKATPLFPQAQMGQLLLLNS